MSRWGRAPVSVQSMTTTKTADVDGTLAQVYALKGAGADIVRITCNDVEAAQGLAEIVPRSPVPIIADIHFQYRLALARSRLVSRGSGSTRATSATKTIKTVARAAGEAGIPIRSGSTPDRSTRSCWSLRRPVPEALVESALREVRYLEDVGFYDIKISVKHSHVPSMVEAYRLLAEKVEYPLHLGVTEAGPPPGGLIKSVAGIGTLLLEGIGDTIRFSLTADPVEGQGRTRTARVPGAARETRARLDRLPIVWAGRSGRDRGGRRRPEGARGGADPDPGGGHGLCGQWARRGARPISGSPPAAAGATCLSRVKW